jgi:glutamate racemase
MSRDMERDKKIGVFDSGVGGLTVLALAAKLLPAESYVYFGDTAHAPYGGRSKDEVRQLSLDVAKMLYEMGCKALVVACNTATSAAVRDLREIYAIPVIGMEPAVKPALKRGGKVLVMATPLTLKEEKFKRLCSNCGADEENVIVLPCPGLVEMVERGETEGPVVEETLGRLMAGVGLEGITAVVLGCTHYLFLKNSLSRIFPLGVEFIDGNLGTVRQVKRLLEADGLLACGENLGLIELHSSGGEESVRLFKKLYKIASAETECVK